MENLTKLAYIFRLLERPTTRINEAKFAIDAIDSQLKLVVEYLLKPQEVIEGDIQPPTVGGGERDMGTSEQASGQQQGDQPMTAADYAVWNFLGENPGRTRPRAPVRTTTRSTRASALSSIQ